MTMVRSYGQPQSSQKVDHGHLHMVKRSIIQSHGQKTDDGHTVDSHMVKIMLVELSDGLDSATPLLK